MHTECQAKQRSRSWWGAGVGRAANPGTKATGHGPCHGPRGGPRTLGFVDAVGGWRPGWLEGLA